MSSGKTVKVLDKTIDILMLFIQEQEPLGVTEISKELCMYKSAVHRILNTLKCRGFIRQDPETKKYWLGSKFYALGMLYHNKFELLDIVKPYLEELASEFNETVNLAIFDELDYSGVFAVERIEGSQHLSLTPPKGLKSPSHASAVGKALLAFSPPDIQNSIFNKKLEKFTEYTIVEKERLLKEFKAIKKKGYAVDYQELEIGLVCFAVPLLNKEGWAQAGISISGPKERILQKRNSIVRQLKKYARMIILE